MRLDAVCCWCCSTLPGAATITTLWTVQLYCFRVQIYMDRMEGATHVVR